ncbi:hypothetical protein [Streptosporangium sp. NBC_01469]|uniref:hypothetical protein n=1 Tax=Streptosporangium sp. NBC_01469 TaxID=2903898 RepID=UPI002E288A58|nr:hypothetical protein [Streptosporangium sp. NBC_01469]
MALDPDAAVARLRVPPADQCEHDVPDEDVARLRPLRHANLDVPGCHGFRAGVPAGGGLRPLRDPAGRTGRPGRPQVPLVR